MIGGVFLLACDPGALADWYQRHLGWQLNHLADDGTYYIELYYREADRPKQPQHLVYAIMPGDPGEPGRDHTVNYRVDDVDTSSPPSRRPEWRRRLLPLDRMRRDRASSFVFTTLRVTELSSGSI
jgi:hypothetical protein